MQKSTFHKLLNYSYQIYSRPTKSFQILPQEISMLDWTLPPITVKTHSLLISHFKCVSGCRKWRVKESLFRGQNQSLLDNLTRKCLFFFLCDLINWTQNTCWGISTKNLFTILSGLLKKLSVRQGLKSKQLIWEVTLVNTCGQWRIEPGKGRGPTKGVLLLRAIGTQSPGSYGRAGRTHIIALISRVQGSWGIYPSTSFSHQLRASLKGYQLLRISGPSMGVKDLGN